MHAESPVACLLPSDALAQRLAWIRRVTARSLLVHRLDGAALRLQYGAEALPELEEIVQHERQCCPFLTFSLQRAGNTVALTIEAPNGLGPDARWLFDQFLPDGATAPKKTCGCAPGACG